MIYVRAVRELIESGVEVRGLAHITGEGLLNLLRLEAEVGYLHRPPAAGARRCSPIASRGSVEPAEMYEVFNMGCGFCCVVAPEQAGEAVSILARRHPGAAVIGRTTTAVGVVELPHAGTEGLRGTREGSGTPSQSGARGPRPDARVLAA